jgi:NDP-sugar pyrophosphorylase family protein
VLVENGLVTSYAKGTSDPRYEHLDYGYIRLGRLHVTAPPGELFDLSTVLAPLIEARALGAVEVSDRFHDIGTPEDLAATDRWLRERQAEAGAR